MIHFNKQKGINKTFLSFTLVLPIKSKFGLMQCDEKFIKIIKHKRFKQNERSEKIST